MRNPENIFVDFDGVIVDSIDECYKVSSNIFFGLNPTSKKERIKDLFYEYRGLVGPVYQYYVLFIALSKFLNDNGICILKNFSNYNLEINDSLKNEFEYLFFSLRSYYQKNVKAWTCLHRLTTYGKSLQNRDLSSYYIVTTKDKRSVNILLDYFNIKVDKIYDRDDFKNKGSKGEIISSIMDEKNLKEAIFIDDSQDHLKSVNDKRVNCFYAKWGYELKKQDILFPNFKF